VEALSRGDYARAAAWMNSETGLRRRLTPEVLDDLGRELAGAARRTGCGARFTGAGGGGCLWAIGEAQDIARLQPRWREILSRRPGARLLPVAVAGRGVIVHGGAADDPVRQQARIT
jgi:D-glycero-alpha-D-manno-heptose-7-phosphate kinase